MRKRLRRWTPALRNSIVRRVDAGDVVTIENLAADDYHGRQSFSPGASGFWSASQIRTWINSRAEFWASEIDRTYQRPESKGMRLGKAVHAVLFEQSRGLTRIPDEVLNAAGNRSGKAWDRWLESRNGTAETLLTPCEHDSVLAAAAHCRREHGDLLGGRAPDVLREISMFWRSKETGERHRARIDLVRRRVGSALIVDLKTGSASESDFLRSAGRVGYAIQQEQYRDAVAAWLGLPLESVGFLFLAQSLDDGVLDSQLYELSEEDAYLARQARVAACREIAEAVATGNWKRERVRTVRLPRYHWQFLEQMQ